MKKKSTFWTYVRRVLLVVVLLVVVICLSVYFLDQYKASNTEFQHKYADEFWKNLEENGFLNYEQLKEQYEQDDSRSDSYISPINPEDDIVTQLSASRYYNELNRLYEDIQDSNQYQQASASEKEAFEQKYNEMRTQFTNENGSRYTVINYLEDNYTKKEVLKTDKYRLVMNILKATFTIEELDQDGNVKQSWLSNPTEVDAMFSNRQNSQLVVKFIDGDRSKIVSEVNYDSFSYSTDEASSKTLQPNFYVNEVKNDQGETTSVIVYYVLEDTSIDYTYFPQEISKARMEELLERSRRLIQEKIAEYYEAHKDDEHIVPYGESDEAYKDGSGLVVTGFPNISDFNDLSKTGDENFSAEDYNRAKIFFARVTDSIYKYRSQDEKYVIDLYNSNMKKTSVKDVYYFLYYWCGYTFEDLEQDTGTEKQQAVKPRITVAIEYSLNENGLETMIHGNSLSTNKNEKGDDYLITSIDVLPYFTAVKNTQNEKGYAIIPDGSGAIMEFDNGRTNYVSYAKRLYSSDLSVTSYTLETPSSDILFPFYAYVYQTTGKAVIAEVTQGAAQAILKADVSGRANSTFNNAYYTLVLRESQRVVLGTSTYTRYALSEYTRNAAEGDYAINYIFVDDQYDLDYSGIAKCYRDILINRSEGKLKADNDKTNNVVLDLEVLASYTYDANFLGIGYDGKGTLTTVSQLDKMIQDILALDDEIQSINVYYKGWRKENLKNASFKNIGVNSNIGGKKALLNLINSYNQNQQKDVSIYPYVEFMEYTDIQESFGKTHYVSRDVSGAYATKYPYELNSGVYNKKADEIMVLSPAYYLAFANTLGKNYSKVLGIDAMAISGLGSKLSGTYKKNNEVFKSTAVEEQIRSFEKLREYGVDKLALETPYAYALEYASNAYNVPYSSTLYEILDYSIPFYQLVINGLFDYSGDSINANVETGLQEQLMKCIETGSNLAFTFTYDDSSKLLQTDYNTYYYTLYTRWLDDVKTAVKTLNSLGIYNCRLVNHQRLDNNVYKVTYANDIEEIEIILNYQRVAWTDGNYIVPAKSYQVID
ncbi:MAG: DUF5696 domain-containing protein [Prevotella sp.]|nr:DUF5696 domain-containing protein [Staphylococcus sp.]MCM1350967.1 DUF5696 domain-containing protein [Prevotella sp.]